MARTQTLVQLNDELLALLDERAARERRSRSTLIREALEMFLRDEIDGAVGRRIVEGGGDALGHRRVDGVARLGTVEGDEQDAVAPLGEHRIVGHRATL